MLLHKAFAFKKFIPASVLVASSVVNSLILKVIFISYFFKYTKGFTSLLNSISSPKSFNSSSQLINVFC